MGKPRIGVLVVDDSPTIRQMLTQLISENPRLMVIGEAINGEEAVRLTRKLKPDVISMDIHMPEMNGFEAVRAIMQIQPTPIVVVSGSLEQSETSIAFESMQAGALAVLQKPPSFGHPEHLFRRSELLHTLEAMAGVTVIHHWGERASQAVTAPLSPRVIAREQIEIVGIGSSTGGPSALATILGSLREDFPVPIVIVQHISSGFEEGLAVWLDSLTPLQVMVAQKGQSVQAGQVLIAPSGTHMQITPTGHVHLVPDKDGYLNIPSATMMMASLAESYGSRAMGVLLTGMGDDGAAGLRMIYDAGGHTIAQDEQSCVVFGMPREAIALGAARYVRPLDQIARTINAFVMQRAAQASASV